MNFDPDIDLHKMLANASNDLERVFYSHNGNLVHKWHHYLAINDSYFSSYRSKPLSLLGIGVSQGGSLQMWKKYFGQEATITGIDINPNCKQFEEEQIKIFIGSQDDEAFLDSIIKKRGLFDIIIDDGSHICEHQISSFNKLFPHLKENGIYLIEDLHTSYWERYGGGYLDQDSFIEFMKHRIDDLNSWYAHETRDLNVNDLTKTMASITFYDSIAIIEKKTYLPPPFRVRAGKKVI